jgi:guanylate kinase
LEESERRAGSAYRELKEAHDFEYVIPNHDGGDSDSWEAFYWPATPVVTACLAPAA